MVFTGKPNDSQGPCLKFDAVKKSPLSGVHGRTWLGRPKSNWSEKTWVKLPWSDPILILTLCCKSQLKYGFETVSHHLVDDFRILENYQFRNPAYEHSEKYLFPFPFLTFSSLFYFFVIENKVGPSAHFYLRANGTLLSDSKWWVILLTYQIQGQTCD